MFEFLEKLRAKPEPVRHAISFWSAIVLTLVIASVWANSLIGNISSSVSKENQTAGPSPFEVFKNLFSGKVEYQAPNGTN
ncbi:MAG TPA: hypothetical protein VI953_03085 [Candidatus Paceibacterota bacterium]